MKDNFSGPATFLKLESMKKHGKYYLLIFNGDHNIIIIQHFDKEYSLVPGKRNRKNCIIVQNVVLCSLIRRLPTTLYLFSVKYLF